MMRGQVPFPMMRRQAGKGDLGAVYAVRKLRRAKERQNFRKNERPDDMKPHQPAAMGQQPGEEGENESRISGARLEEMLKLAGGQEVAV